VPAVPNCEVLGYADLRDGGCAGLSGCADRGHRACGYKRKSRAPKGSVFVGKEKRRKE
jgi:hypothetical protein